MRFYPINRPGGVTALAFLYVVFGVVEAVVSYLAAYVGGARPEPTDIVVVAALGVDGLLCVFVGVGLGPGVRAARMVAIVLAYLNLAYGLFVGLSSMPPDIGAFLRSGTSLAALVVLSTREAKEFFRPLTYRAAEPST